MFHFTINGRPPFDGGEWYQEGDAVAFEIPLATDTSTNVVSDDVYLGNPEYGNWCLKYKFIMPPHDVDVRIITKNTMVNERKL